MLVLGVFFGAVEGVLSGVVQGWLATLFSESPEFLDVELV